MTATNYGTGDESNIKMQFNKDGIYKCLVKFIDGIRTLLHMLSRIPSSFPTLISDSELRIRNFEQAPKSC